MKRCGVGGYGEGGTHGGFDFGRWNDGKCERALAFCCELPAGTAGSSSHSATVGAAEKLCDNERFAQSARVCRYCS